MSEETQLQARIEWAKLALEHASQPYLKPVAALADVARALSFLEEAKQMLSAARIGQGVDDD